MKRPVVVAAIVVAAATLTVFAPAVRNGFVDWDDNVLLVGNPHYRGLGWAQLRWMFTTALMGHWTPIAWLTLGADYVLWGMQPAGYHATSVVLHAAAAVVCLLVALALLAHAMPAATPRAHLAGAVVAALVFAVHPLRAESVAWVTERRDVVSGLLYLVAVFAYVRMAESRRRWPWLTASVVAYALALGSKVVAVTLPLVLVVLDVYPLHRLPASPRSWTTRAAWHVWIEKLPWAVLALAAGGGSALAMLRAGYLTSVESQGPAERLLLATHSAAFYVWKTVIPTGLSPEYELRGAIQWTEPRFAMALAAVVAISAAAWTLHRRWPAGAAVWTTYLALLVPVSGLVHTGHHLVADRYTYLACLPWAVLAGSGVIPLVDLRARTVAPRARTLARGVVIVALVGLGTLASLQATVWRDTETLWRHALDVDPDCVLCHNQLGADLGNRGLLAPAIAHFERAVALRPDAVGTRANLALALSGVGRVDDAIAQWRVVLARRPDDVETATRLAIALLRQGRPAEAVTTLEPVVRARPAAGAARATLAQAYRAAGRHAAATEEQAALERFETSGSQPAAPRSRGARP